MASVAKRRWTYKGSEREAWVVRYHDRAGVHRSKQFERKKQADDFRRQVENELDAGTHVAQRESRTVADLIEEFRSDVDRRHEDGRVGRGYVEVCRTNLRYVAMDVGAILLRDLRWQDVERTYHGLARHVTRFGRPLTPRSKRNILTLFGTVVAYGVRRGYAARNVVPDALREIGAAKPAAIDTFDRDEIKRLLLALEDRVPGSQLRPQLQLKAMVYLATVCGLRRGEILGLTLDHFDFGRGVVHVRQALDAWDGVKGPKTMAGVRDVPMPLPVAQVVRAYAGVAEVDCRGLLFRGRKGAPFYAASFNKIWHSLLLRAGFPPKRDGDWRHFHALRHFAGSAWLASGVPLAEVSKLMGHAHVGVTAEIYSHAIVGTLERSAEIGRAAGLFLPAPVAQELRKAA